MAAIKFLAGFICLAVIGGSWGFGSNTLRKENNYEKVIRIARKEIGVVERTGKNDGARIAAYLSYCGIGAPAPYCAAYLSWCFGQADYKEPKTAWSPALFPISRLITVPKPGIV
jgi:hypothetical protein